MPTPPVSLGLPVYNAEPYLSQTIAAIKAQTFPDFEVIVVLDGCRDRSEEILRAVADERFVILKNETNQGVCHARNQILERAAAPLLAWMDADDTVVPERMALQTEFMHTHPEIDVLGAYFDTVDEQGRVLEPPFPFPTGHEGIKEAFRVYGALHNAVAMYRTERIRAIGGYDAFYAEDYSLYLKCLAHGYRFANLPEVLLHYRRSPDQIMRRLREPTLQAIDRAYFRYGPQIWGDHTPDYIAGMTRWHRARRRLRRLFHDWRKDA
jgi:glycosyltransferase involved in cell wall biosynthesis